MTFALVLTPSASADLARLRKHEQQRIRAALEEKLAHQPLHETKNRKKLRPNPLADWELRVGEFRVFYDVFAADALVKVIAVGYKEGNKLFIRGKEYQL